MAGAGGRHWQGCRARGAEPGTGGSGHSADQPFRRGPAAGQRGSSQGALEQTLQPGARVLTGASQKPHPQECQEWQPKPKAEDLGSRWLRSRVSPHLRSAVPQGQAQFLECLTWENLPPGRNQPPDREGCTWKGEGQGSRAGAGLGGRPCASWGRLGEAPLRLAANLGRPGLSAGILAKNTPVSEACLLLQPPWSPPPQARHCTRALQPGGGGVAGNRAC